MSGQVINYQGDIFRLDVLANVIHCPVSSYGASFAGGNSKAPLFPLRFFLCSAHRALSFFSVCFFLMVINFIFNHFHSKYIERY